MIREISESVASRMFSIELSVTVEKKKHQVLFTQEMRLFYNTVYIQELCVAFKTNDKSVDLLKHGKVIVFMIFKNIHSVNSL